MLPRSKHQICTYKSYEWVSVSWTRHCLKPLTKLRKWNFCVAFGPFSGHSESEWKRHEFPNACTFIRMAHIWNAERPTSSRACDIFVCVILRLYLYTYTCTASTASRTEFHCISFALRVHFENTLAIAIAKMQLLCKKAPAAQCGQHIKCNLVKMCVQILHENMFTIVTATIYLSHGLSQQHHDERKSKFHFGRAVCVCCVRFCLFQSVIGNLGNNATLKPHSFERHILQITSNHFELFLLRNSVEALVSHHRNALLGFLNVNLKYQRHLIIKPRMKYSGFSQCSIWGGSQIDIWQILCTMYVQ